ncbi:LPD1 domain-containing protein [Rhizobium sp. BK176]|uniref:LPD1 domain-containing protein n=1 Tax=Rhizobium sp. BK176 TaxID=2587071 RepID=UPI002168B1E7|nr:LPD1 domain-containing protein [Rhizobium sp. BK176]MCS4089883.1 hypothetical protein [Rhizobium sp. BK176]
MEEERKRKIDDAGEKIGGARKDWARERMAKADVDEMTDVERVEHIQKDNVWPKPDYAALVEAGMSPEAAAQIKVIRDRIAKAPAVSRRREHSTTLVWYYETLSAVGAYLEGCKTLDEVMGAQRVLDETIARRSDRQYHSAEGRDRFDVIRRGRHNPLYCPLDDKTKIAALLNQGFPGDVPPWRRGHVVKKHGSSRDDFIVVKGKWIVGKGFSSEQEALDWLKNNWEEARAATRTGTKKTPDRPHLDRVERVGLSDRRGGEDVSPQTFLDVFGFRGVQFGDWLPDDERQLVLNHGYDALMDLAEAIGFTPGQLSLDGTLAIAFGARGLGGAHSAHYEPGQRVVNLTRLSGAGALAHEWGHALDHMLGDGSKAALEIPSLTGWRTRIHNCRGVLAHRGEALATAAQGVLRSLYFRPKTRQEALAEAEKNIAGFQQSVASWEKSIDSYLAKAEEAGVKPNAAHVKKLVKGKSGQEKGLKQWEATRDFALSRSEFHDFGDEPNQFYTEAAKISGSGGYWARPNELFARAFEAVVTETLKETSSSSTYLVAWADARFYPEELYKGNPYPSGDDLARLRTSFDDLIGLVADFVPDMSAAPPLKASKTIVPKM